MSDAARAVSTWRPSKEELDEILDEMRPIITAFAQRARPRRPADRGDA